MFKILIVRQGLLELWWGKVYKNFQFLKIVSLTLTSPKKKHFFFNQLNYFSMGISP